MLTTNLAPAQVPPGDNYYAALNCAVFSDGSFVYIPKGVNCPMELSTYFRINAEESGQVPPPFFCVLHLPLFLSHLQQLCGWSVRTHALRCSRLAWHGSRTPSACQTGCLRLLPAKPRCAAHKQIITTICTPVSPRPELPTHSFHRSLSAPPLSRRRTAMRCTWRAVRNQMHICRLVTSHIRCRGGQLCILPGGLHREPKCTFLGS